MIENITAVAAIIAALAAIIAPVITSLIEYKKSVHLKKIEIFESAVQSSITDLTKTFADLEENFEYKQPYVSFLSAAYTVSARINDELVQAKLNELLQMLRSKNGDVDQKTTECFDSLLSLISNYLRGMQGLRKDQSRP